MESTARLQDEGQQNLSHPMVLQLSSQHHNNGFLNYIKANFRKRGCASIQLIYGCHWIKVRVYLSRAFDEI